jgi:hypothetical protein
MEFGEYILHFRQREDYLRYTAFSLGGLPVAIDYAIPYCKGLQLGPIALVCGARLAMTVHFGCCPASTSSRIGLMSESFS